MITILIIILILILLGGVVPAAPWPSGYGYPNLVWVLVVILLALIVAGRL